MAPDVDQSRAASGRGGVEPTRDAGRRHSSSIPAWCSACMPPGCMDEILQAIIGPFAIVEAVARETLYVYVLTEAGREQEPVELDEYLTSGLLRS